MIYNIVNPFLSWGWFRMVLLCGCGPCANGYQTELELFAKSYGLGALVLGQYFHRVSSPVDHNFCVSPSRFLYLLLFLSITGSRTMTEMGSVKESLRCVLRINIDKRETNHTTKEDYSGINGKQLRLRLL
jgi:hypothetical protein